MHFLKDFLIFQQNAIHPQKMGEKVAQVSEFSIFFSLARLSSFPSLSPICDHMPLVKFKRILLALVSSFMYYA